jgi:hypothetical protein
MNFALGEDLVYRVILEDNTTISETNDMLCTYDEGCTIYTENFIVQDVDGNVFDTEFENWYTSVPVFFAKGEVIPSDSNFTATFELSNIEYLKERINIYDFMYNLNNVIILEDNLFLIERQQWSQGVDNFIITFDETTQNYSAKYTNISAVTEITEFNGGYIAINDDETAIINFVFNETVSSNDYYYFDVTDLTDGLSINGVNDLIVDYDGSIYFKGVDNFIQDITGSISDTGVVTIDVEIVEREVIRVRPIN